MHQEPADDARVPDDHGVIVPGIGPRAPHLRIGAELRAEIARPGRAGRRPPRFGPRGPCLPCRSFGSGFTWWILFPLPTQTTPSEPDRAAAGRKPAASAKAKARNVTIWRLSRIGLVTSMLSPAKRILYCALMPRRHCPPPGGERAAGDETWSGVRVAATPASPANPESPTRLPFSNRSVPTTSPDES